MRAILAAVLVVGCLPACHESPTDSSYTYVVPAALGDGWQTASIEAVGLRPAVLGALVADIRNGEYSDVHGILIVKDGMLVFEEYFPGYTYDWWEDAFQGEYVEFDAHTLHNIHSVTKSITSTLVGIAIDQGLMAGVEEPVFGFFPEYAHLRNDEKDKITLGHLLTMTSGLAWNENEVPPGDTANDVVRLFMVPDPIAYFLSKPVVTEPGGSWSYNSGGVNVLGEALRAATGMRIDAFATGYLFHPLDIAAYEWRHINPNVVFTSGDLRLRPRDMAKLGQLYLSGGVWNGERIVSQAWTVASTQEQYSSAGDDWTGYGYLWWVRTYTAESVRVSGYQALGWGGQRVVVLPQLAMVVVFTGGNYLTDDPMDELIERYVLPAALN